MKRRHAYRHRSPRERRVVQRLRHERDWTRQELDRASAYNKALIDSRQRLLAAAKEALVRLRGRWEMEPLKLAVRQEDSRMYSWRQEFEPFKLRPSAWSGPDARERLQRR